MKAGTLDASYIDNAREIMRREHEINLKENGWWMNVLYNYTYNKEDFDYIINYDKYINSINLAGVTEAAKKYLDMGNWKEFILYPED